VSTTPSPDPAGLPDPRRPGDERPLRRRATARVLLLDDAGQVLLMHDSDPGQPGRTWWMTPGGGVDPGESLREAAAREVVEETGWALSAAALGAPVAERAVVHGYSDVVVTQLETYFAASVGVAPALQTSGWTAEEQRSLLGHAWWGLPELLEPRGREVWPRGLAGLLGHLLAGRTSRVSLPSYEESTVPVAGPAPRPRRAARVIVVDGAGRLLLLRGHDPARPGDDGWWFTVGGGLDEGETAAGAAARELAEETGLRVPPAALGSAVHRRTAVFAFEGDVWAQEEELFVLRTAAFTPDTSGWTALERRSVTEARWWTPAELSAAAEPVHPAELLEIVGWATAAPV